MNARCALSGRSRMWGGRLARGCGRTTAACLCVLVTLGGSAPWATGQPPSPVPAEVMQPGPEGPVALRVGVSRTTCSQPARDCVLLKVDYSATGGAPRDRPTFNLALVIDSSGSMAEARKLPYTLEAARWVVENLTDADILSVVTFNDNAIVLSAAGRVVNKPFLLHRLDEIIPEHYTNLSAGLLEGIAQVDRHRIADGVNQVLLLTDGQANRGETDPHRLRTIAQQAHARGIGVSTFGVGTEFNETLTAGIAEGGAGHYSYIANPEQIPAAFKDELRGLLQVMAQNIALEVDVTGGAINRVFGQIRDQPTSSYRLALGDLRMTENGMWLAELARATPEEASLQAEVRLVFDNPQGGGRFTRTVRVQSSSGLPEDPSIVILASTLDAVEQADIAAQGLDVERYRRAQASFAQLYARAHELALRNRDQQLLNQAFMLKHFMEELAEADNAGLLHGHREARERLQKESHYLHYLLTHHRPLS